MKQDWHCIAPSARGAPPPGCWAEAAPPPWPPPELCVPGPPPNCCGCIPPWCCAGPPPEFWGFPPYKSSPKIRHEWNMVLANIVQYHAHHSWHHSRLLPHHLLHLHRKTTHKLMKRASYYHERAMRTLTCISCCWRYIWYCINCCICSCDICCPGWIWRNQERGHYERMFSSARETWWRFYNQTEE